MVRILGRLQKVTLQIPQGFQDAKLAPKDALIARKPIQFLLIDVINVNLNSLSPQVFL